MLVVRIIIDVPGIFPKVLAKRMENLEIQGKSEKNADYSFDKHMNTE